MLKKSEYLLLMIFVVLFLGLDYRDGYSVRKFQTDYNEIDPPSQGFFVGAGGTPEIIACGEQREKDGESKAEFIKINAANRKALQKACDKDPRVQEAKKRHCKKAEDDANKKCNLVQCELQEPPCQRLYNPSKCKTFCIPQLKKQGVSVLAGVSVWAYAGKNNAGNRCRVKCTLPAGTSPIG